MPVDSLFQGSKLRVARQFHGQSLADLGKEVLVSRQFVQQLECGTKQPSVEVLEALASVLGFEPRYFLTPSDTEVHEEDCNFRSRRTTTQAIRNRVAAGGTLFRELVDYLDRELSLPPVNIPQVQAIDHTDIERAVEVCRRLWALPIDAPLKNMTRVVENAGCVATTFGGVPEDVDALSIQARRPIIMRSSAKASTSRYRFDLAHECAHLVMHRGIVTGSIETEAGADYFASALLLPRAAFVREFPRRPNLDWIAMFRLKSRWGVSIAAIVRRAYDLDLISASQFRWANVHIRQRKWQRGEPEEPAVENPEVIPLAFQALQSMGHTPEEIASHIGFSLDVLRELTSLPLQDSSRQPRRLKDASGIEMSG